MSTGEDPTQESPRSGTDVEQGAAKPTVGSNGRDAEPVEGRRDPREDLAEIPESERPADKQDHDVLVFPRRGVLCPGEYFRHPVTKQLRKNRDRKVTARPGEFRHMPERMDLRRPGVRRAVSVARLNDGVNNGRPKNPRGPAFAAVPIKEEPIGSYVTCHLINVEHLANPNLWTVEEWNDGPLGMDYPTPKHPENVEFLVALPWGKVFRFKVWPHWPQGKRYAISSSGSAGPPSLTEGENPEQAASAMMDVECVDLKIEPEIWSQLRNGCIAGSVRYSRGDRIVPLVNVTALNPEDSSEEREQERKDTFSETAAD